MRFFGDVEKRSLAFMECQPGEPDGRSISRETYQYHLGCLAVCQDVWVKAREYRLRCRDVWNSIENELQSSQTIIRVTNASGEADGVPACLKVNAALPFLHLSQRPSADLLSDHVAVHEHLQEQHTLDEDDSGEDGVLV